MLLTSPTAMPMIDRASAQRMFNDLAIDLSRSDSELTSAVYSGNRVGAGWDTWFKGAADRMLQARDAYIQLMPQDVELGSRLSADTIDLAASSGQLYSAYHDGDTFGAGWDTTLDRKIDDVRTAADRLYSAPAPGPYPSPVPNPGQPSHGVGQAAQAAATLARQSLDTIMSLPVDDRGSDATKQARIAAFNQNKEAQAQIEPLFETTDQAVSSQLHTADAHLEDANWQLAKKPSPDGRFNGVDVAGARRDTEAAIALLDQLAQQG
jgi:hypothetical protein